MALLAAAAALLQVLPAAAALSRQDGKPSARGLVIAQTTGVTIRPSQGFAGQNSGAVPNFIDFLGGFAVPVPSLTPLGSSDASDDGGDDKKKKEKQEEAAAAAAASSQP